MLTAQRLDETTLDALRNQLPKDHVLTAICDVNPASEINQGGALRIRIKNQLAELELPDSLADSLTSAVLDDLGAAQQSTRSRAYFVWDEHGHLQIQTLDAQLELTESVQFGPPDLEPLRMALLNTPRRLIVLVDHDWGRLFTVRLGEILELKDLLGLEAGRRVPARNTDDNQYEAHQDQVFWNVVVERLTALHQSDEFDQLLIAGPPEMRSGLTAQLTSALTKRLVGSFHAPGDASPANVLASAQPALEAAERDADLVALEAVRERGVQGPEATLTALQEGNVYELLMTGDGSDVAVWYDTQGYVFAVYPEQGISPLTGAGVEKNTLRGVLADLRERFGLKVRVLRGDQALELEGQMDGLAGVPRHADWN
jgi:Bacterial archaeo-eukaryotic release factor family 10